MNRNKSTNSLGILMNYEQYTSVRAYSEALDSMVNVLGSRYISNLMLEAGNELERQALAKRTNPVSLTVTTGERYMVTYTDGIEDTFEHEPLWACDQVNFIALCKRWYGEGVIFNYTAEAKRKPEPISDLIKAHMS